MEFAFELALCAHLERATDWVLARQLGAGVEAPGNRVVDVAGVIPGPGFEARAAITDRAIPVAAVESDAGVGEAVFWKDAFGTSAGRARRATERAIEVGFFECERRNGRDYVRQTARYPEDWVGTLVGVENKPDLGSPGDLRRQLRLDASLALFDRVVLATESYVTRAHLNRIPEPVGVWRFDPDGGDREVVREASPLPVADHGVELLAEHSLRTDVALVSPKQKRRARRRVAERAYGKGWRTYGFPACVHATATGGGRPFCEHFDRVVDPASDCGEACAAFEPGGRPDVDRDELRAARTPWVPDPDGGPRRQAGLDRFGE